MPITEWILLQLPQADTKQTKTCPQRKFTLIGSALVTQSSDSVVNVTTYFSVWLAWSQCNRIIICTYCQCWLQHYSPQQELARSRCRRMRCISGADSIVILTRNGWREVDVEVKIVRCVEILLLNATTLVLASSLLGYLLLLSLLLLGGGLETRG